MKLIYTKFGEKIEGVEGSYRNAEYFDVPEKGVSEVVVQGDYPKIEAMYEAEGVPVEVVGVQKPQENKKLTVDELRHYLTEKGIENPEKASKAELFALYEQAGGGDGD